MDNVTDNNKQHSIQLDLNVENQMQQPMKMRMFSSIMAKSFQVISGRMDNSWKDFTDKLSQIQTQTAQTEQKKVNDEKQKKTKSQQKSKLKIQINVKNMKKVAVETPINPKQAPSNTFISEPPNIRKRTRSQHNTQLKSIKKANQQIIEKEEQEKKVKRLKEINQRKMQLMDRLKKIDSQLIEVKRQSSPIFEKNKSYLNNIQKSFISNLNHSRSNKPNENVVEQHFKIVQKLQKINNQKIKRQQKLAEQFKKKQQIQIMKVQQLENKKRLLLQQKSKRNELAISKLLNNKNKTTSHHIHPIMNQFNELGQNSLLPMTMINKTNGQKRKVNDGLFLQGIQRRLSNNLLTERDNEYEETIENKDDHAVKQNDNQLNEKDNENQLEVDGIDFE